MTFLFGYSFLAKGWTKEYRGLARFDMLTGMLVPYTIATSLMIIAAGTTIHSPEFVASGAVLWSRIGTWIAIPTSALALIMLPVAYIGFLLLNNSSRYLGDDMPRGRRRFWWNTGMILAISVTLVSVVYYLVTVVPTYFS